mmetsp:Transcript_13418/g.37956  ORF Transcript_13418/g.37956 Transcript_13418/m.37956 type:complete len:219 (-) Transcript_13418:912-1568(-)
MNSVSKTTSTQPVLAWVATTVPPRPNGTTGLPMLTTRSPKRGGTLQVGDLSHSASMSEPYRNTTSGLILTTTSRFCLVFLSTALRTSSEARWTAWIAARDMDLLVMGTSGRRKVSICSSHWHTSSSTFLPSSPEPNMSPTVYSTVLGLAWMAWNTCGNFLRYAATSSSAREVYSQPPLAADRSAPPWARSTGSRPEMTVTVSPVDQAGLLASADRERT